MATATVYIDGFNFYYRHVKDTPYKWLDFASLAKQILPAAVPIKRIRYFTARVKPLPHDPHAADRQQVYLRALATIPNLTIHLGRFMTQEKTMPLVNPRPGAWRFATVWDTEEKGSDVNFATYLLLDAFRKESELALIITNDSDLEEAIRIAKTEFGVQIWLLRPREGYPSVELGRIADQIRTPREALYKKSQFPNPLPDGKGGTIAKPATW